MLFNMSQFFVIIYTLNQGTYRYWVSNELNVHLLLLVLGLYVYMSSYIEMCMVLDALFPHFFMYMHFISLF
jgi:hypothetical protein